MIWPDFGQNSIEIYHFGAKNIFEQEQGHFHQKKSPFHFAWLKQNSHECTFIHVLYAGWGYRCERKHFKACE